MPEGPVSEERVPEGSMPEGSMPVKRDLTVANFAEKLSISTHATGPLCLGVDPSSQLLDSWGIDDCVDGLRRFCDRSLEAFVGTVGVIKAQVAFFERFGARGIEVLESFIQTARGSGVFVIADAKRSDIASSAEGYAQGWLDDESPLCSDALTVVAYMGLGALSPIIDKAVSGGKGVFVVVRSSNPEGRSIQEATGTDGVSVEDRLLAEIAAFNGKIGLELGPLGAVVGATLKPSNFELSQLKGVFLVPGIGAQGATFKDVEALFKSAPTGSVLPVVARSVLAEGPDAERLRAAAERARDEAIERLT